MNQHEDNSVINEPSTSLLDRFYTFSVVSGALTFLALAFWPFATDTFVVESQWSYKTDPAAITAEEIDKIKYAIKSSDSVDSAIDVVAPSLEKPNSLWQRKVAESVSVDVEPDSGKGEVKIRVRAGGNNEDFCRELLVALQDQFHGRYHRPVDHSAIANERKKLEDNVVTALKSVDQQQARIDAYLRDQMEQAKQAAEKAARQSASSKPSLEVPVATTTATPPIVEPPTRPSLSDLPKIEAANPEYIAIQKEISKLETMELAAGSAPSSNEETLARLRSLLNETPKSVRTSDDWITNPFSSDAISEATVNPFASDPNAAPVAKESSEETADDLPALELALNDSFDAYAVEQSIRSGTDFQRLRSELEQVKQKHFAALDALKSTSYETAGVAQEVVTVKPPRVVSRFRSGLQPNTLWKVLVPSVLIGLCCAAYSATKTRPPTLYSTDDVQSSLELPIVGKITTDQGPTIEYPQTKQREWARWSRHAAEITLVASLLCVIYALATYDGFSEMLGRDPFTGFMTAVDQVKGLVFKQG